MSAIGVVSCAKSGAFAWAGRFDAVADTDPAAPGPLAAPPDCPDAGTYRAAIRNRYAADPGVRQQLQVLARRLHPGRYHTATETAGPWADTARDILRSIAQRG